MVQEESVHISKESYFGLGKDIIHHCPKATQEILDIGRYVFSTWQPFTLYYTGVENDP